MTYEEGRRRGNATVDRRALSMAIRFSGLTKAEIARRAGIVPTTITNLQRHRTTCSVDTAAAIAKALEVPTRELFLLNTFTGNSPLSTAA
ncbi:helix-turn-helix transcriptional regulator [Nesterenkonia lacusekhoensis]|uniref:DNA-binding XRE family transcriptional regulator n=1 Tax=Nesterenkonia lacusekhoensis TaxID=150832 RepID=A0ABS4T623_9MICC|nr:helix-turn-helix transcriptional regulator [Nesterenkonia lacusekhoensis]MBP2319610.1 DNA-binding XRE family transcriptional regulator [Nesterenkonia lacusekhoensis]